MVEMMNFKDSLEKVIYVSDLIRQNNDFSTEAMYFLQLEIDELNERYKKVSDTIEELI